MDRYKYAALLGMLISHLQSLEFLLRTALYRHSNPGVSLQDIDAMTVGQSVAVDNFTNYDSLSELINKYNNTIATSGSFKKIDEDVVLIRDALCHGRISSPHPSKPMRIIKFDRPSNNSVLVAFSEVMDEKWFNFNIEKVLSEVKKSLHHKVKYLSLFPATCHSEATEKP